MTRIALRHSGLASRLAACRRVRPSPARPRAAATQPNTAASLPAFVEAAGGDASGVAVRASGAALGYSLVAARPAKAGDTLVSLPRSLLLADGAPGAALPPPQEAGLTALQAAVPPELWGGRLAVRLLAHRAAGEASIFAPYLAALPTGFSVPLFFSREAVDAAREYAPFHAQIVKRAAWVSSFARDHLDVPARTAALSRAGGADPLAGVTVDAGGLGWALAAVTSRAFAVAGASASAPRALLPLIDMANHAPHPTASVAPGPGGGVTLRAEVDVVEGAPITLSYGALSSEEFLGDYGFLPPDAAASDSVVLRLDGLLDVAAEMAGMTGSEAPVPAAWRAAARASLGPPPAAGVRMMAQPPFVDSRLLAEARISAARDAVDLRGRDGAALGDPNKPLAPALEARALRTLAAAALVSLGSMGTPADADRAALAEGRLPADVAAIVEVRVSKKNALSAAARGLAEAAPAAEKGSGACTPAKTRPAKPKGRGFG